MQQEPLRIPIDPDAPSASLAEALDALARGALVAVPTETLYTLVCRADHPGAVERLTQLGGESAARLVRSVEELPRPSPIVRRLAARYWPGPLVLALPERWRAPAHPVAAQLIAAASFPLAGVECARDPQSAAVRAPGQVACLLDAGPARLAEPAAVLELVPGKLRLVRAGLFDLEALRSTAGLRIGFVCTGNTCRSPMAEGLARTALATRLGVAPNRIGELGFTVQSMGVYANPGERASDHAVATLAARGIDLSGHRAHVALPDIVSRLDRVYALTRSHLQALKQSLPPGKDRHCTLLDPDGRDISDPIGGPRSAYEQTAAQIERAIAARLDDWA
jgi:protein-tyrosine phosphatase